MVTAMAYAGTSTNTAATQVGTYVSTTSHMQIDPGQEHIHITSHIDII